MTKNTADPKVTQVVAIWNDGFANLQKRKEAGEKISEKDVRAIVIEVGQQIYASGITCQSLGSTKDELELKGIYKKVEGQRFPLSSVSSSTNNVKVNTIQLAAIEKEDSMSKGELIANIIRDPDFVPAVLDAKPTAGSEAIPSHEELPTVVASKPLTVEEESAKVSRKLLAQLAPPEDINNYSRPVSPEALEPSQKPKSMPKIPLMNRSGATIDSDSSPAQIVQMPIHVVQPIDNPSALPRDALGRIIH